MSESVRAPSDQEIDAWVDDRLAGEDLERVRAALDADPALRSRAHADRASSLALRRTLDRMLGEPVPQALVHAALGPAPGRGDADFEAPTPRAKREPANAPRFARAAAILVAASIGAAGGWIARSASDERDRSAAGAARISIPLTRAASVAHAAYAPEVRHPVEVGASEQAHLVAWLSKRLGTTLKVPQLDAHGYRLVGGRLLPDVGRGVAAQFMFESAQGRRLTLFVRGDEGGNDTAFRFATTGGLSTFYWLDRGFGYALSGELPREAMLAVATEVYRQINP